MQSLPPAGLPFEEFRVWSFKHVAKYGQPVLRQSRSKQEKLRKVKAYFKSLENEPNQGDKNRSICKTKQVRSDMQDMEYRDFSKFKAKMIRHNKKTRIANQIEINMEADDNFTINGVHKILCPVSPGTTLDVKILKKTNVFDERFFYGKQRKTCKNKAVNLYFPHLIK